MADRIEKSIDIRALIARLRVLECGFQVERIARYAR